MRSCLRASSSPSPRWAWQSWRARSNCCGSSPGETSPPSGCSSHRRWMQGTGRIPTGSPAAPGQARLSSWCTGRGNLPLRILKFPLSSRRSPPTWPPISRASLNDWIRTSPFRTISVRWASTSRASMRWPARSCSRPAPTSAQRWPRCWEWAAPTSAPSGARPCCGRGRAWTKSSESRRFCRPSTRW